MHLGMHEVCALILLALNQEALAWGSATLTEETPTYSHWAEFMIRRAQTKKLNLLNQIEQRGDCPESTFLRYQLQYSMCEESEVYSIFDRVMTRGLRVVYCPEVTDGLPSEALAENMGIGYLNVIQGWLACSNLTLF